MSENSRQNSGQNYSQTPRQNFSQNYRQNFRRNIFFKNCGQHFVTQTLIVENFNLKLIEILVSEFWGTIKVIGYCGSPGVRINKIMIIKKN